ncbi:MAG: hypothetical protein RLY58_1824 [Pseudomonadota bacterium]|jgi:hypothetical protein
MPNHTGFVAGTLVHTDQGLVPIEQINVGNLVLSKHESGDVAYKRVLKTFKSPEKHRIMRVGVTVPNLMDEIYKNEFAQLTQKQILSSAKFFENSSSRYCSDPYYVYCTENHPFWTDELRWLAAIDLFPEKLGTRLTMSSCYGFKFTESENYMYDTPLLKTYAKDVAALRDSKRKVDSNLFISLIDFSGKNPVVIDIDIEIPVIYEPISGRVMSWNNVGELESPSAAQPSLKLSSQPEHVLYKSLTESGYLRTGFDAYCMECGYTHEDVAENESLFKTLKEDYLDGSDTEYYTTTAYNIEIEDYHTYFVSEVGILVNTRPTPK